MPLPLLLEVAGEFSPWIAIGGLEPVMERGRRGLRGKEKPSRLQEGR